MITTVPAAEFAKAHVDASVMTTTCVESAVVAPVHRPVNDPPKVTVDCVGTMTPVANVTVIVFDEANAPDALAVKPTVHDVVDPAVANAGAKVTLATDVADAAVSKPMTDPTEESSATLKNSVSDLAKNLRIIYE